MPGPCFMLHDKRLRLLLSQAFGFFLIRQVGYHG